MHRTAVLLILIFLSVISSRSQSLLIVTDSKKSDTLILKQDDKIRIQCYATDNSRKKVYGRVTELSDSAIAIKKAVSKKIKIILFKDIKSIAREDRGFLLIFSIPCGLVAINLFITPISPILVAVSIPVSAGINHLVRKKKLKSAPLQFKFVLQSISN